MADKKEIMGDIPNGTKVFSKKLGKTDREAQLIIPTKVLEQFRIQNGYYEREFTAWLLNPLILLKSIWVVTRKLIMTSTRG